MQAGMYSALFGALSNELRMNTIANNLANVNTTGYKQDKLAFEDTFQMYASDFIREPVRTLRSNELFPEPLYLSRTRLALSKTAFAQGALKATGSPLDAAIAGDGFFKIQMPDGEFYTRDGQFHKTAEGTLITSQGFPVIGDGGEITIPPGVKHVSIAEDGRIYGDDILVGQLAVVAIADPDMLEKLGQNMYRPRDGANVEEAPFEGRVVQGFLEAANVDPVYEMVNMIEAQRHFEALAKVMQTSDAIDKEAITKVGRGRV